MVIPQSKNYYEPCSIDHFEALEQTCRLRQISGSGGKYFPSSQRSLSRPQYDGTYVLQQYRYQNSFNVNTVLINRKKEILIKIPYFHVLSSLLKQKIVLILGFKLRENDYTNVEFCIVKVGLGLNRYQKKYRPPSRCNCY